MIKKEMLLLIVVVLLTYLILMLLLLRQKSLKDRLKKEVALHQMDLALLKNKVYLAAQALAEVISTPPVEFNLQDVDWDDFIELVNHLHQGFVKRLLAKYPNLTKGDVQICCLTRLGFSNQVISTLMNQQAASYARRKSRIKQEKMNGMQDERSFEEIIEAL
jgi:hypothetical protein